MAKRKLNVFSSQPKLPKLPPEELTVRVPTKAQLELQKISTELAVAKAEEMKAKLAEKIKANPKFRSMTDAEMSSYLEWEDTRMKSISNQIVEYFP